MSSTRKGYRPMPIDEERFPARKAYPCLYADSIILPISTWRTGAVSLCQFSTQNSDTIMHHVNNLHRSLWETTLMALQVPVPHEMEDYKGDIKAMKYDDVLKSGIYMKNQAEVDEDEEGGEAVEEEDDDSNEEESEDGEGKRKNKNGGKNKKKLKPTYTIKPSLFYQHQVEDNKFEKRPRFRLWFEWLVKKYIPDDLASMYQPKNIVGIRLTIGTCDPNFSMKENFARLIDYNNYHHLNPPKKTKPNLKRSYFKREIFYQDESIELNTGYERIIEKEMFDNLVYTYSKRRVRNEKIINDSNLQDLIDNISTDFMYKDIQHEKLLSLGVCAEQMKEFMRPLENNYLPSERCDHVLVWAQPPLPECTIEMEVSPQNMGQNMVNLEFPFVTLRHYLNRCKDIINNRNIYTHLFTDENVAQLINESGGLGEPVRGGGYNPQEHEFRRLRKLFSSRVDAGMTKLLRDQILDELTLTFDIEREIPTSVIEGIKLQQTKYPTLVQKKRLVAHNLDIFANMIVSDIQSISSIEKMAHEATLFIMMIVNSMSVMSDVSNNKNHLMLVGSSGSSKSFFMMMLKKFLPKDWVIVESYSSAGAMFVDDLLSRDNVIWMEDEADPRKLRSRESLSVQDHKQVTGFMSLLTTCEITTKRNNLTPAVNGDKSFKLKIVTGPQNIIYIAGSNIWPANPNLNDRIFIKNISHPRSILNRSTIDYICQENDKRQDDKNQEILIGNMHKMFLATMYMHKGITVRVVPEPSTNLVMFYARKLFVQLRKTNSNVVTKVRALQRMIELYKNYVYYYAYRCAFGDDNTPFLYKDPSAPGGVKYTDFDIKQIMEMANYFGDNEQIAIYAITQMMEELLSTDVLKVIRALLNHGCNLPPVLFSEWVRYTEYMLCIENALDDTVKDKPKPYFVRDPDRRDVRSLDMYCSFADRFMPQTMIPVTQEKKTRHGPSEIINDEIIASKHGIASFTMSSLVCPKYLDPGHLDSCKDCKPGVEYVPKIPDCGFFHFPNVARHPSPWHGQSIEFMEEEIDGIVYVNLNYLKILSNNVKDIKSIPAYIFNKQTDGNNNNISLDEITRVINMLSKDTYVNTHWIGLRPKGEVITEYSLAELFTPRNLAAEHKAGSPMKMDIMTVAPIRTDKNGVYVLTTLPYVYDCYYQEEQFLKSVENKYTRDREVLLGHTVENESFKMATYHLKPNPERQLFAFNPSHLPKNIADMMEELDYKLPSNTPQTIVKCDPERFFSESYFRNNNISQERFLPEAVETRLKEKYATEDYLARSNKSMRTNTYPASFFSLDS